MTAVIRTSGLCKKYGRDLAVDHLDLDLEPGEIFGFLGPNGAGKTTTIRLLMGIIAADAGIIELFGVPRRRPTVFERAAIGYVSQDQHFYPWMSAKQLGRFVSAFYPRWDNEEYARLLTQLDVPPDRKTSALSGGAKAKLALALALSHRPPLLVLDEPTAGLDPLTRHDFLALIREAVRKRGCAVFLSSHLLADLEDTAQRIAIMNKGRRIYLGNAATLQREIRSLPLAAASALPPELTVLSREDDVLFVRASEAAWAGSTYANAAPVSLEQAFVAMVRQEKR